MYQGYLGKITDFRICDKIVGLGIYKIKNINFNGCSAIQNMKCLHENQSYPSPELEFYKKLGITFEITMGCWGSKFDMEFPSAMLEKEDGLFNNKTYTYDKSGNKIWNLTGKDKFIVYSPKTKKAIFSFLYS